LEVAVGSSHPGAVLVTGCSTGIGRALAIRLARSGYDTWATARRLDDIRDLEDLGCRVLALDVTDEASMVAAVGTVEAERGRVWALVNNAGYAQMGPLEEIPPAGLRRQFETNVFGVIRLSQLVLPGMRAASAGRIVVMGSTGGFVTVPGGGAYHMTKYALESFADALRLEVRRFGVQVSLIEPPGVASSFHDTSMTGLFSGSDPAAHDGPYAAFKERFVAFNQSAYSGRSIISADTVAGTVLAALEARKARARYPIGLSARLARSIPSAIWDATMRRQLGL
jgi:NAD(P)-dependent dehydrogenase (short-subunit alcohol dehydrogenase family)